MVETGGLENRLRGDSHGGSNPSSSAILLVVLALGILTLLAYSNSFQTGFALDSKTLILRDPRIREATGPNLDLILQHSYWWPYGESGLYRPFTTLSYLFNYAVLGNADRPAGYHWINWVLHLGNAALVYAVAFLVMRQFWPAAFTAALWSVHPASTEAVTNIAGRPDLLAAMAVLGGLLIYGRSTAALGWHRIIWIAALAATVAVGAFSKESAVTVAAVVLLYEWQSGGRRFRRAIPEYCAIAAPLVAMWLQRTAVLAASGPAEFPFWDNPLTGVSFVTARLTALKVMARYLGLTVWPLRLSGDYSYAQIVLARGSVEDWLAWIAVAAAVAVGVVSYRRRSVLFFFLAFAFVTFLPVSNLVLTIGSIMAERFLYLPSMGLIACIVLAVYAAGRRTRTAWGIPLLLCLAVAGFSARTWARNLDWRSDLTMGEAAVRTSPNSFKTHYLLSVALYESDPAHSNLARVLAEADRSLAILEPLPDSINDAAPYRWAGECHLLRGDASRAIAILSRAVAMYRASPGRAADAAGVYRSISTAYLKLNDASSALESAAASRKLDPGNAESYRYEAQALLAAGRPDDAAAQLMAGVFLTADSGLWQELTRLYRSGLDAANCAMRAGAAGPALNPACAIVRRHYCAAAPESIEGALQTARPDLARRIKAAGLQEFGCDAASLNRALQ